MRSIRECGTIGGITLAAGVQQRLPAATSSPLPRHHLCDTRAEPSNSIHRFPEVANAHHEVYK